MDKMMAGTIGAIGAIAALVVASSLASLDDPAVAQQPAAAPEYAISVRGTASAVVEPDLLRVSFGVESIGDTAHEALRSNSETMTAVMEAMAGAGVREDEIGTANLRIHPNHNYDPETGEVTTTNYGVSNMITVETGKLDLAADIVDSGVEAGIDSVRSVQFTLSDQKRLELQDSMVGEAMLDAEARAEEALRPLGYVVLGIKSATVDPADHSPYGFPESGALAMASADFRSPTPLMASGQTVTSNVHVTFLIGAA